MKRHTFLFLLACLLTAVLTVPAAAVDKQSFSEGFYPTRTEDTYFELLYRLSKTDAETLALAAYDADGTQIGSAVVHAQADDRVHAISLSTGDSIDTVKLFQLDGDLAPAAPAEILFSRSAQDTVWPRLVATVTHDDSAVTGWLYYELVDRFFDGEIDVRYALAGETVYFYQNPDGHITANVLDFQPYQVTGIITDLSRAEHAEGHRFLVELNDGSFKIYDDDFNGFDYAVGDYILAVLSEDETQILTSEPAKTLTGTVTAERTHSVKINDTYYVNLSESHLNLMMEYTVVLNQGNQIVFAIDADHARFTSYAYVDRLELDGDGFQAWLISADGIYESYLLDPDTAEQVQEGTVIRYRLEEDGRISLLVPDLTVLEQTVTFSAEQKFIKVNGTRIYADSKTRFIFIPQDENDAPSVTTGIKNVDILEKDAFVICNVENQSILGVFLK